jgi:UDP-N-acetylglucosamine--dolichyl-phosphate N-acetylglucosaminephosphotransferase
MGTILLVSLLFSFTLALVALPKWIGVSRKTGLVWEDMNKFERPKNIAASGGIVVIMAFVLGVFSYMFIKTFVYQNTSNILEIFSLISVILIFGIIGLIDDLFGWRNGGLSVRIRIFLALIASIPLMVINAGDHVINLFFMGPTNIGILYPIILIPLGIAGAATTYNFLAGFNGLEAGQGILILSFLSFVSYSTGAPWLAIVGLCMVVSLIAFYIYNKFPSKVFPGDTMTYAIGALIAGMAILGNFERIAIFIFIPYILEIILKLRGGLKKQSFGIPDKNGGLKLPYKKIYSLTHLSILIFNKFKKKVTEKDVVYLIFSFQIIICLLALFIFKNNLL